MTINQFTVRAGFQVGVIFVHSVLLCSSTVSAADQFLLKPSMQLYLIGTTQTVAESRWNPDNAVLKIEDRTAAMDLRPSLKLDNGPFQLIARPQMVSTVYSIKIAEKRQAEHSKSRSKWLEAYGNWTASDKVLVSYGIQNYQWGAAESVNPSNRIFHETIDSKGLIHAAQGKNLMRLNVTWLKNLSTVFIAETEPIKDATSFQAEVEFETKSLMKHEVSWNSGADYFGLVYGAGERSRPWVGEYFNLSLFDGLSIYADASHQRGSAAWYPVESGPANAPQPRLVELKQSKFDELKVYTFGVGGLRYSFEGGSDVRLEYIVNNAGWTEEETARGLRAIDPTIAMQLSSLKENAGRWVKPGLEYRGQRYGLASIRIPDFLTLKDLTIYLRGLSSLQDNSASGYSSMEYGFGDASTLILSGLASRGERDQELRGFVSSSVVAGIRQDF